MKFKSKGIKLIIRKIKEDKQYITFRKELAKLITTHHINTETELIKYTEGILKIPRHVAVNAKTNFIQYGSFYENEYAKFIYDVKKNEIKKLFKYFLIKKHIAKIFNDNINTNFIEKFNSHDCCEKKYKTKQKMLFKMVQPQSFVMRAFEWNLTKEGHNYWENINKEWEYVYEKYLET